MNRRDSVGGNGFPVYLGHLKGLVLSYLGGSRSIERGLEDLLFCSSVILLRGYNLSFEAPYLIVCLGW